MQNNIQSIINGFDFDSLPINITFCGKVIEGNNGWDHYLYSVSIGTGINIFVTQYKCGLGHVEKKNGCFPAPKCNKNSIAYKEWEEQNFKPKHPKNSDIMYSLLLDAEAGSYSFQDFCDNFGYLSDSVKAFNIYQLCEKTRENLRKVFTSEQLQQMQIALEDY